MKNGKSGGKSVGKGKNEWTRAKLFNGLHATAERRAKRTTWIYAKRVNFMFRERATLATLPLPFPSPFVRKTRPIGFIFVPPAFSTRVEKKEFACVPTFRAVWNFSTSGRKRPRESLEDISVRSRASGLRNDRWARVLSRVTEKVSFFLPPRRMCQVVFHFLRDPSVIKCHFFFSIDDLWNNNNYYRSDSSLQIFRILNWIIRQ